MPKFKIKFKGEVTVPCFGFVEIEAESQEAADQKFTAIQADSTLLRGNEHDVEADPASVGMAIYHATKSGDLKITGKDD